jgi:hypothetical protein
MKFFYILLSVLTFNLGPALAAKVIISSSTPLKVGQQTMIKANVSDAAGLEGAVLSVIFDGAQDAQATQVDLGKIGDAKLEAYFIPTTEPVRVTVRFSKNGKNYANVANIKDLQSNAYEFRFDQEASRASTPIIQFGAIGAYALRNTKSAF